jgi:protein phosphatase 2C family protein 2/3
LDLER